MLIREELSFLEELCEAERLLEAGELPPIEALPLLYEELASLAEITSRGRLHFS